MELLLKSTIFAITNLKHNNMKELIDIEYDDEVTKKCVAASFRNHGNEMYNEEVCDDDSYYYDCLYDDDDDDDLLEWFDYDTLVEMGICSYPKKSGIVINGEGYIMGALKCGEGDKFGF